MRGPTLLAMIALAGLGASAHADDQAPSFELRDRGDAVEVIAHHVKAARTAILPVRSRLEIPIVTGPLAKRVLPSDATVKLIELDSDGAQQMLSVKLGFERPEVKALARFAQAVQIGDDLHVIVPRKLPVDGMAPKLPEPTNLPAAAKLDAVARPIEPAKPADAKPDAKPIAAARPVADARPVAAVPPIAAAPPAPQPVLGPALPDAHPPAHAAVPRPDARPEPARPAATPTALKPQLASDPDDAWPKIALYGALGLAAAGAGIWMMKRKKALAPISSTIEVIAQRSLGGKARVVWLSAGQREMLVSVTAQQVRMLGQWRKADAPAQDQLPAVEPTASGDALRGALLDQLERRQPPPRRQTATLEAQRGPTGTLPAQRRPTGAMPAQRPPTGAIPVQPAPLETATLSPAVSGILRLRGRTSQMPAVNAEIATGDVEADELWAREILAATGARR